MDFIDLFAGIGGFHQAMHAVGGRCVFASEIDKFARKTYEANYRRWSPELFQSGNFNEDITDPDLDYRKIPKFDVLCAGFPCQAFSHAGLKRGFDDTRGTLFFNIEEIVRTKLEQYRETGDNTFIPKVLFLENVKGLRGHDKGRTFRIIKQHLEDLGYEVRAEVLNSKYFGVPQNRERIFIIAWYRDLYPDIDFQYPFGIDPEGNPIFNREELDLNAVQTRVGQILFSREQLDHIERETETTTTISDRLWQGHQRRRVEHAEKGNGFGYSLFNENSPYTSTISARYYKDGSEILIDQREFGLNPRKLHPIEAARLQGYPVDHPDENKRFIIPVSANQAYKQFGNSVSVPVIKAIANQIRLQLIPEFELT